MSSARIDWHLHLEASWKTLAYTFPDPPTNLSAEAAIYCWVAGDESELAYYIGETEWVKRRIQHFRTPGPSQQTNQRLHALFNETLAAGGRVELQVLVDIRLNGDLLADDALSSKSLRRLLEAWCVREFRAAGRQMLNR